MAKLDHIKVNHLSYRLVDARQRNGSVGTTKSDNIGWMKEIVAVNGHDPRCFFTKRFITVEARLKQILNGHI